MDNFAAETLATDQGAITYWVYRADTGRPWLLFLPGLTADHRLFEKQVSYFGDKYNILVWDAPGHGQSRPFRLDFSMMDMAEWLRQIIQREGINQPYIIGQSMGGYVTQCYLERYPGSLAGFVAIDSAPLQKRYTTQLELWLLGHMESILKLYPWESLLKSGAKSCATTQYGQALMRTMIGSYNKVEYCKLAGFGYGLLAEAIKMDLPYAIDCPALLLCGQKDRAGSVKRYNRRWAAATGLPLVWVPGAGHNSNGDAPEFVNQQIEGFVRG